jgi:SAM-dependent methyltransferase
MPTKEETEVINSIYQQYEAHCLSEGNEQLVFTKNMMPRPRTYHVFEQCLPFLPREGILLDIGSGNGAVLKSASQLLTNWQLHAFDIVDKYRDSILEIPNVKTFSYGTIKDLPAGHFDLIVLWHVLEHVPDLNEFMQNVKKLLSKKGFLLIQIPDVCRNPFDLGVIDHCSHFTLDTLQRFFESLGFCIAQDGYHWTDNCLTLLLNESISSRALPSRDGITTPTYFDWLNRVVCELEDVIAGNEYAIFGTGMASIYLLGQLSTPPRFLIDEDNHKEGKKIGDIPIITPNNIPKSIDIIMPFPWQRGVDIAEKLKSTYHTCQMCKFIFCPPISTNNDKF